MTSPTQTAVIQSAARTSTCGQYRYWLSRVWDDTQPIGAFICLNPSKADALLWDQTLAKCNNLAVQWGWGGFYMLNLFAYYATEPADLKAAQSSIDTIGPENDQAILEIVARVDVVVLAWGNGYKGRAKQVLSLLGNRPLYCIAMNKGKGYLHPNRIKFEDYPAPTLV